MDWLTFIAQIVESLAWPLTIIALFLILKKPLIELIPGLKKLRYKDFEIEIGERAKELQAEFASTLPKTIASPHKIADLEETLIKLANISPKAAVSEAWLGVEKAAKEAGLRNNILLPKQTTHYGNALMQAKIITEVQANIYLELRKLRNVAAHALDENLTTDEALSYCVSATQLASYLNQK